MKANFFLLVIVKQSEKPKHLNCTILSQLLPACYQLKLLICILLFSLRWAFHRLKIAIHTHILIFTIYFVTYFVYQYNDLKTCFSSFIFCAIYFPLIRWWWCYPAHTYVLYNCLQVTIYFAVCWLVLLDGHHNAAILTGRVCDHYNICSYLLWCSVQVL